jgi:hypothetical protein
VRARETLYDSRVWCNVKHFRLLSRNDPCLQQLHLSKESESQTTPPLMQGVDNYLAVACVVESGRMKIYADVMVSIRVSGLVSLIPILSDTSQYRLIPNTQYRYRLFTGRNRSAAHLSVSDQGSSISTCKVNQQAIRRAKVCLWFLWQNETGMGDSYFILWKILLCLEFPSELNFVGKGN